jgi:hypothetical protein
MLSFAQKSVVEREPQTAFEVALTGLDESWLILAGLQIGPKDEIAADYVALHPARGIALIDLASNTRNDPKDRLRRLLSDSQYFTFHYPGVLPVVRLVVEATDAATIADRLEAAFAEAPAITIAKGGWANAVSDMLTGRVRGTRLPAHAMTERPEHLTQRHENTTSALDLDAWKYAPWRRPNDRPGHDTAVSEMPRRPGGFIERPELSRGATRSETVPVRRAIAPALQRPRSSFALLLGVVAGGMMGGGAVWLALSGNVGDRFEDASGVVSVALEPPSLVLQAQTAPQHETLYASPDAPEFAQPTPTGSSVSPAENTDGPAPPPLVVTPPLFGSPTLSSPPLATPSPLASLPASSPPTLDNRPGGPPARLHAQPAPETSAASAQRPMQTSEPRSKSAPTKQAGLKAPKPKRYDGPPMDADQLPPLEGPVIPPAQDLASTTPDMHPPTNLLSRSAIVSRSPVVSCRAYTSTQSVLGQPGNARGVACREPDGQWTVVQESSN